MTWLRLPAVYPPWRAGSAAVRWTLVALIRAYQVGLRPHNPWGCKFQPTCSGYALEAVRLHGPWRGASLAARRLLRCRPGTFGGIDPVPEPEDLNGDSAPLVGSRRCPYGYRRYEDATMRSGNDGAVRSGDNPCPPRRTAGPALSAAEGLSSASTGRRTA